MECARIKGLRSVGFSLISAGVFRGQQSLENVLRAGIRGISSMWYRELEEVHMVALWREELTALEAVCNDHFLAQLEPPNGPGNKLTQRRGLHHMFRTTVRFSP